MPKVDLTAALTKHGDSYPPPLNLMCAQISRTKLGNAVGLTDFGVSLLRLPPGQWSAQRHWHEEEDEFVMIVEGEVVLVEDGGETVLVAGDFAGFPRDAPNGHHLQNRSGRVAVVLEIGSRRPGSACHYPDVDLEAPAGSSGYVHKDGTPY
ncbi:cupin domain-containing protein [Phenylobacterium sp.]|uniref:cupin domain-containing protein n=1 Tax=Phenylobacterium sp. TaxID=1871053 RepID=UPI002735E760|nr:cupin domain-containing protein [Phenylobacterium sp.]MDP3855647.1 cupin domain-containing protein [Phenylobacterium sp.]